MTVILKVLIVDDDELMRKVLARLLKNYDFDVETSASGHDALERITRGGVDLLLSDFIMPGFTGLDLIKQTRALSPATRCLIMSGQPRSLEAPEDVTWLSKPIDLDELLKAVT